MKTKKIIEGMLGEKVDRLIYLKDIKCFRVEFDDNREDFYIRNYDKKRRNILMNYQIAAYKKNHR